MCWGKYADQEANAHRLETNIGKHANFPLSHIRLSC